MPAKAILAASNEILVSRFRGANGGPQGSFAQLSKIDFLPINAELHTPWTYRDGQLGDYDLSTQHVIKEYRYFPARPLVKTEIYHLLFAPLRRIFPTAVRRLDYMRAAAPGRAYGY